MPFKVRFTDAAARDLEVIHSYLTDHDSAAAANRVLDKVAQVIEDLGSFPERGAHPPELLALGIKEYRAVFFKPYKVIYRLSGESVFIHVIADGRRDMQNLLSRRLLGA